MLIDATHAEETRVVVLDGNKVDEFDFESLNKRQLAGNIYLAKVTRVEPSLQAAFVDYGGNRHGFLAFSEIHPDYYQIPKADRDKLLAEEAEYARQLEEDAAREKEKAKTRGRSRSRRRSRATNEGSASQEDAVLVSENVEATDAENTPDTDQPQVTAEAATPEPHGEAGVEATEAISADQQQPEENTPAEAKASETASDEAEAEEAQGEPIVDAANEAADDSENSEESKASSDDVIDVEEDGEDNLVETPEDDADYENVGGADEPEERRVRKPTPKRYKIQEVIKVRQILLVQVVKEERGNKGAAITTYLSLAGRYCVLMPNTARGGGISRKITNVSDRKKLKEISNSIVVPEGAGLIIRTAGSNRTKTEIKRDYEYLLRQWEQIRDLTMNSIAPCLIYEEGSLIKRVIRDLYARDIGEVLVDGERGYREAKDYMKMLMPSHAKNVKHYTDPLPLYSRFQIESYLAGMFNPVVQLKSGGYIVIDVTEALVAIDVNSGRATREFSIEDTALRTNLEAAEEAARQMRLRDLAGLIVIDFIDMEQRKNNAAVEKKIKDCLKNDRARIQVGKISSFGLMELSRQRLRPGMIEATTKGCPHCHGTGRVRSDDSIALALLREVEEEGVRQRSKEVLIAAPVEVANYLLNQKREHIAMIESRFGLSVRVEGDVTLINPDYRIERFKTATRTIAAVEPLAGDTTHVSAWNGTYVEDAEEVEDTPETETPEAEKQESQPPKKKRRRRRRGGSKNSEENNNQSEDNNGDAASEKPAETDSGEKPAETQEETPLAADAETTDAPAPERKSRQRRRSRSRSSTQSDEKPAENGGMDVIQTDAGEADTADEASSPEIVAVPESGNTEPPKRRKRVSQPAAALLDDSYVPSPNPAQQKAEDASAEPAVPEEPATVEEPAATVDNTVEAGADVVQDVQPAEELPAQSGSGTVETLLADADETAKAASENVVSDEAASSEAEAPKKRGWWSRAFHG